MADPTHPPNHRWMVLGIVMTGTLMATLDSSIVNVALPHMMSAFGVNRDQIEWVVTAFMLTMAVVMPLMGWAVNRLGHKYLYLGCLGVFTVGSALCAFAWSYDALVAARILQALGGGAIQPVGMAIVAHLFEPHERGKALGIWGTGIMIGPALGPTLGGYLTDAFSWRSIFSVNLPVGVMALVVGTAVMRVSVFPKPRKADFDWFGFSFLSIAIIGGLLGLSQGQQEGWDSRYIHTCFAVAIAGLVLFLGTEGTVKHPLLDLNLFKVRNFTLSMVLAIFRAVGLFGGVFLFPMFLESLVGYTTIQTGLWMMPGAVAVGITMQVSGRLADRYSPRWLVVCGTILAGFSLLLFGQLDPLSGPLMIIGPQLIRGVGLAFMMTPLLTTALNSVPRERVATASSFLNVAQQVGGSFGIAILNTFVTNSVQTHAVRMGEHIGLQSAALARLSMRAAAVVFHAVPGSWIPDAYKGIILSPMAIVHRATVMGFDNGFMLAGIIVFLGVPLAAFLKPARHHLRGAAAGR